MNRQSLFAQIRDDIATESMLKRLEQLMTDAAGALAESRALRTKMRHTPKGQKRDLVEIEYDRAMVAWAKYESLCGDIIRDSRYIAYMDKQAKGQG